MARRITEIRVGIAVLLALALLVFGVTWLSDVRVARARQRWHVRFPDVGGLAVGDPVNVSGVQKGRVEEIHLIRGGVVVTVSLDREVLLTRDSRVFVRNTGLIGEKFIAVDLIEDSPTVTPRDTIPGVYESGVPEVISRMGDALISLQSVSEQLDRILTIAEQRGHLENTLENVETATGEVALALRENRRDLREITENFKETSYEMRMLVLEKSPVVDDTVDRLAVTAGRADTLVTRLDRLTQNLNRLTSRMSTDSTSFGKMLADRELYDDFRGTLRELNLLMKDVKQNPRKYFNFSLF